MQGSEVGETPQGTRVKHQDVRFQSMASGVHGFFGPVSPPLGLPTDAFHLVAGHLFVTDTVALKRCVGDMNNISPRRPCLVAQKRQDSAHPRELSSH